jgi:dihydropteroate synthase
MRNLRARQFVYPHPGQALIMGIVNVTPDSFSNGGELPDAASAIQFALELEAQGADILDIGGESTRPHSLPVSEEEEMRRVLPVIEGLAGKTRVPISIDTMKPSVARAAVARGASIINDVAACRNDREMWDIVAESGSAYVCMHMKGTPQTMQENPSYRDVRAEVREFFIERLARLRDCGVTGEQVILDPGIGFGKTLEHNLELLGGLSDYVALEQPVLLGVSRKSFIGKLTGAETRERLPGALACACLAVAAGVRILRVHDVRETVQAVRMAEAILEKQRSNVAFAHK